MNNIFKKQEMIQLGEGYTLSRDSDRGVVLTFSEETTKTNKKTGIEAPHIAETKYYYPSVGMALNKYVELSQNSAKDLEEVVSKTNEILTVIKEFKDKFGNWN
jgi:hypothetical protein